MISVYLLLDCFKIITGTFARGSRTGRRPETPSPERMEFISESSVNHETN